MGFIVSGFFWNEGEQGPIREVPMYGQRKDPRLQKKRSPGRLERVWSQSDMLIVNSDPDSLMPYLSPGGPLWEMRAMIHPFTGSPGDSME